MIVLGYTPSRHYDKFKTRRSQTSVDNPSVQPIKLQQSSLITDLPEILEEIKSFYDKVYAAEDDNLKLIHSAVLM